MSCKCQNIATLTQSGAQKSLQPNHELTCAPHPHRVLDFPPERSLRSPAHVPSQGNTADLFPHHQVAYMNISIISIICWLNLINGSSLKFNAGPFHILISFVKLYWWHLAPNWWHLAPLPTVLCSNFAWCQAWATCHWPSNFACC